MFLLRLLVALLLLTLGVFAVFRVPVGALWKPAVGATAFGVWLLPLAVGVALTGENDAATAIAFAGALLLCTPLLRAVPTSERVAFQVVDVFGDRPWSGTVPVRSEPYTLGALLKPGASGPGPTRLVFAPDRSVPGEQGLYLDLYPGEGPGPHPVVVAIHGGSWNAGDPTQLPAINRYLAARGITVIAPRYRLAPTAPFPAAHDDVEACLAWIVEHGGEHDLDPDRVVLLGRSAGGHLALLSAYRSSFPGIVGVVALYAPSDLNWSWENPSNPWVLDSPTTLSEFLGGPRDQVPEAYTAASPIEHVGPDSPPTLLLHGTRDELVFAEQSRRLARALGAHQVPHVLVETGWDTHGFDANLGGPGGQLYVWCLERFLGNVFERR